MRQIEAHHRLDVDTETTGLRPWHGDRIVGVSVATPHKHRPLRREDCFYFPIRHAPGGNLSQRAYRGLLAVLRRKRCTGWNYKFDAEMFLQDGMLLPDYAEDVMLAAHLANENEPNFKLKETAVRHIDPKADRAQRRLMLMLAERKLGKGDMWRLRPEEVEQYACDDVFYTEGLRRLYVSVLKEWDLLELWREVNRYMLVTARMEGRGMLLDLRMLRHHLKEAETHERRLERRIQRMAGYDLNVRSSPQLQRWLGLPSSAREYLEEHLEGGTKDPRAKTLLAYRQWSRVRGVYYQSYLDHMDGDGVLHPNINLHGTISGRPSANDPNMQAVPRWTDVYKVKDVFVARPGHTLVSADYSQMELRFGAHYAKDRFLIRAFREHRKVHQETANELKVDYDKGKRINFAVLYGASAEKLAKELHISEEKTAEFLDRAHKHHPNYRPLHRQIRRWAEQHGYVRMWSGRVRRYNCPQAEPYRALSNLIQGGVAEVMRYALCSLDLALVLSGDSHLLLQVHDQALLEVPTSQVKHVVPVIREKMIAFDILSVPLEVEIKTGHRWSQLKEVA